MKEYATLSTDIALNYCHACYSALRPDAGKQGLSIEEALKEGWQVINTCCTPGYLSINGYQRERIVFLLERERKPTKATG